MVQQRHRQCYYTEVSFGLLSLFFINEAHITVNDVLFCLFVCFFVLGLTCTVNFSTTLEYINGGGKRKEKAKVVYETNAAIV